jgi:hypothetical protein
VTTVDDRFVDEQHPEFNLVSPIEELLLLFGVHGAFCDAVCQFLERIRLVTKGLERIRISGISLEYLSKINLDRACHFQLINNIFDYLVGMLRARTILKRAKSSDVEVTVKNVVSELVNRVAWKQEEEVDRLAERRNYFKQLSKVPGYFLMLQDALARITLAIVRLHPERQFPLSKIVRWAKLLIRLEIQLGKRPDPVPLDK